MFFGHYLGIACEGLNGPPILRFALGYTKRSKTRVSSGKPQHP